MCDYVIKRYIKLMNGKVKCLMCMCGVFNIFYKINIFILIAGIYLFNVAKCNLLCLYRDKIEKA